MTVTDDAKRTVDSATPVGMTLLGQLVRHLDEARHVVEVIQNEVDLNLVEVAAALGSALYEANQAFEAATLLAKGAALDENWSSGPSKPKAVFARHRAEVARGAVQVRPDRAVMIVEPDPSPVTLDQLPPKPRAKERTHCGQPTKAGTPCANIVVVLEAGVLASACARHLPDRERASYERQRAQTNAWVDAAAEHQERNRVRMANEASALWLRRQARELGMTWAAFCDSLGVDVEDTVENGLLDEGDPWLVCDTCAPYLIETVAAASAGMDFLFTWAAQQVPPRWADRSWPPGHWLMKIPPKAHAQPHEVSLALAVSLFSEVATPTDDIVNAVDTRHHEVRESVSAQAAHLDNTAGHRSANVDEASPARPAQPVKSGHRKQSKKKRRKH